MKRPLIGITGRVNETTTSKKIYEIPDEYFKAVLASGGLPIQLPQFISEEECKDYIDLLDGILFIGGPDLHPARYGEVQDPKVVRLLAPELESSIVALAKIALSRPLPTLGICLGCQLLSVVSGGKLIQDLGDLVPGHRIEGKDQYHTVQIRQGTRLSEIFGAGELRINSCHHQAIRPDHQGNGWVISAMAGEVVEAIEYPGEIFRLGLQWHPERIDDLVQRKIIFDAFIHAAELKTSKR